MRPDPEPNGDVITFLKQHRPSPPPSSPQLEERIMTLVRQSPRSSWRISPWAMPMAIAASLALLWGSQSPRFAPAIVQQPIPDQELEAYLISSWQQVNPDVLSPEGSSHGLYDSYWLTELSTEPDQSLHP